MVFPTATGRGLVLQRPLFRTQRVSACRRPLVFSSRLVSQHGAASGGGGSVARRHSLVVVAAGRSSGNAGSASPLTKLSLAELKARCQELGLPISGKKADLAARIQAALDKDSAADAAEPPPAAAGAAGTPAAGAEIASAAAEDDVGFDELVAELEVELASYSRPELLQCLADRGLDAAGSDAQLVARLAAAVAQESLFGDEPPAEEQQQQQQQPPAPAPAAGQEQPAGAVAGGEAGQLSGAERAYVVADKQQALLEELLAMGLERVELVDILAEMGQGAGEEETLEDLAERASWLLAEEEVLLMEQQAAGGPPPTSAAAAAALAESPSSILDKLTATDINKMKVEELRDFLRRLGLSDEGGRYVLRDRLMTMLVVRRAATAGDMDYLLRQLSQMTLSELRSELERRGLDLSGSKASLEVRLAQALLVELVGPEAAGAAIGALGGATPAEVEDGVSPALLEEYDELLTAVEDPAVRIALVCGTAPAAPGSSSSSSSFQQVAEALATANTLVDELHTAPLAQRQAAAGEAAADAAGGGSVNEDGSSQGDSEGAADRPVPDCGISVDVYWGDDAGRVYQLPRRSLTALTPATLAAGLAAHATATFADVGELARHLAACGTHAALSLLPGGALALAGGLAAACEAAGVALAAAGAPAAAEGQEPVFEVSAAPVLSRATALQELQRLGYATLPVLEVSRQELMAHNAELLAWLQSVQDEMLQVLKAAGLEPVTAAAVAGEDEAEQQQQPSAAGEALTEGDSSSSSSSSSSPLLQAWTAARYEQEAPSVPAEQDVPSIEELLAKLPAFVQQLARWCLDEGLHPELQVFSISPPQGGELLSLGRGLPRLVTELRDAFLKDPSLPGLLVEPVHRQLSRWEVVVVSSPEDGPVALLPAEVERYDVLREMADADLALKEWQLMQAGEDPDAIAASLEVLAADEPVVPDTLRLPGLPDPLPRNLLKLHMPPRASSKVTATIRHAAAKAVAQLGLSGAGMVRVRGWMAVRPDWQDRYTLPDEEVQKMPDFDADQLARMREDELQRREEEPLPLAEYVGELDRMADLARFSPAERCTAEGNGEADVMISALEVDVPLHHTSIAGLQASEVGLGPAGLARHLINVGLARADKAPLLPTIPGPAVSSSAQWAQATGANDDIATIHMELARKAVEEREDDDNRDLTEADAARRQAFEELPINEQVLQVLDALTSADLTQEQLATPPEEPEEWEPEFDPRPLEEVHAERDALRSPEDLAARDMRDEGRFSYGNQPIRYDRWDAGDDWVPPALVQAEAAAAGLPIPSIAELQQRELDKQAARSEDLLTRQFNPEDALPEVTDDQVFMGRLLALDRYAGGYEATVKRRAGEAGEAAAAAGGSVTGTGATAAAAAAAAAALSPEALAAVSNWPWPSEREVLREAVSRLAASRVWVLMGGDGLERQTSLRSGANIVAKLQRCCDLQVDAFLLPPAGAGTDEARRRSALLTRRTEWRAIGIPEEMYPDSMGDAALIDMPPIDAPIISRTVIVMQPQQLGRHSVEEAAEAAERAAALAGQVPHAAPLLHKQQMESRFASQQELDGHLVEGVGAAWGAAPGVLPPSPRFMNVQEFIEEAAACDATVILAVSDTSAASGELQQLLEMGGIPFTGMTSDWAFKCSNRLALTKAVEEIAEGLSLSAAGDPAASGITDAEVEGVVAADDAAPVGLITLPRKVVKSVELLAATQSSEDAEALFEALRGEWQDAAALCIKPPAHSGGMGVARVSSAAELLMLAGALRSGLPRLPGGALSGHPLPLTLPLYLPELLLVEPWVETDPVAVGPGQAGQLEVEWAGSSRWVEVSVGLLGELGGMMPLDPSLIARSADGHKHCLTPAPEHILPPAAQDAAQSFAVALADGLGLRSVAAVDGFVNVDSGEMIVLDVRPTPALTDGSSIMQQIQQLEPPLLPFQLFRGLAQQAYLTTRQAQAAAAAGVTSVGSAAYYAPPDEGTAGFSGSDFDLSDDAGQGDAGDGLDLFGGPGSAGGFGGGDKLAGLDDAGGVEDSDMQGMTAAWPRQ